MSDADYQFVFRKTPRICLDFLIVVNGKIVLTRRIIPPYKNLWHLPGGRILYKESIQDATARIVKAELGIALVKDPKLVGYIEFPRDGKFIHSISLVFAIRLAKKVADQIQVNEQANRFGFFDELPPKMHPVQRRFIKKHYLL